MRQNRLRSAARRHHRVGTLRLGHYSGQPLRNHPYDHNKRKAAGNIHQSVTLLEEDNVRCDLCAGSGLEGIIRQPDSAEQVGSLRDILSNIGIFLIQRTL